MVFRAALALLLMTSGSADQLRRRAEAGDRNAAFALGRAYKLGRGAELNAAEAARWFRQALELGHPKAGGELGLVLFQDGKGKDALPLLKAAAEAGDPRAQYALGTIFFAGKLVAADLAQARRWLARAAEAGLPAAREALAIVDRPTPTPLRRGAGVPTTSFDQAEPRVDASEASAWQAQLGAFAVPDNARRYMGEVRAETGLALQVSQVQEGRLTLIRVAPFASKVEAARFCARQRRQGRGCMEVRTSNRVR